MSRPNVADWQYLGVDKITRRLEWNSGRKARKGHICEDSLAYASYSVKAERKTCYLLGDFNINLINVSNHIPTAEFLEVMYSHAFTPLITKPTRVTSNTATLIDNIFTNSSRNSFNGILLSDISICYAIVHSHEREGSQRQHTECPNYGTLLRAVAAIFHEGLPHRHD